MTFEILIWETRTVPILVSRLLTVKVMDVVVFVILRQKHSITAKLQITYSIFMGISLHVVVFDGRMLGHLESRVMDQYRDLRICVLLRCVLKDDRGFSLYCTSEVFLQDKIYDVKENMIKTWAGAKFRNIRMVKKKNRKIQVIIIINGLKYIKRIQTAKLRA
uniref:Uncharacterized protein n=1 Tax=Rhizophagus irregularis (strain DAOM 181602 / DAOM 197198 / MUCL 43194) TaxID=747089 RepID=U9UK99_RHIID